MRTTLWSCLLVVVSLLLIGCNSPHPEAVRANEEGVELHADGRFDQAIDKFDTALTRSPNFAEAHYNKGLSLYALGRYDEAIASYDQALREDPTYAEALADK